MADEHLFVVLHQVANWRRQQPTNIDEKPQKPTTTDDDQQ